MSRFLFHAFIVALVHIGTSALADRLGDRARGKQPDTTEHGPKSRLGLGIKGGFVSGGEAHLEVWEFGLVGAPLGRSTGRQSVSADFRPMVRFGVSI